ncbi:MAG: hypothetical protein NXI32_05095 [bacterium]|nr:hypothetical protein [bacterium]
MHDKHYSGISIDQVCRLTGLPPTSPALHAVGLPREGDPRIGEDVGKGIVESVWRTATCDENDGLLHVVVVCHGNYYSYVGRETAALKRQKQLRLW